MNHQRGELQNRPMLVCFRLKLSDLLGQIPQISLHPLEVLLDLWLIHVGV
jgi:hypothetical protein